MPDSRPPMFDDGGGLPTVDRSRHVDGSDNHDHYDDRPGPNYLVRRGIAVGGGVLVIALLAIGIGRLLDRGNGGSNNGFTQPDWNTVVSVDDASGTVVLTDKQGEESERFQLGIRQLTDSHVAGSHVVAANGDSLVIASLTEIPSPSTSSAGTASTETSVPGTSVTGTSVTGTEGITTINIESSGTLLLPSGSTQTIIAHNASSERAVLIHGGSGDVIDTDLVETVAGAKYDLETARADPSGRNVLVADVRTGQSVLFSFDRLEPSFFPGFPLAVDDTRVVTAQNVGTDATITVFDLAGEPGASTRTTSVRAGMLVDDNIVLVTVGGELRVMSVPTGEIANSASLSIGTIDVGHVAVRGDRLIVVGSTGTAIVDGSGAVVVETADALPTTTGVDLNAPRRTECLILQRDREVVVVSLDDGTVVAEAIASGDVLAGVNGCAPIVPTSAGYLVISDEGVVRATIDGDVVAISPDGSTIVAENANRLELVPLSTGNDDDDVEPIDVGRSGRTILFADR